MPSFDEVKAALAAKITSREQMPESNEAGYSLRERGASTLDLPQTITLTGANPIAPYTWWLNREMYRTQYGVYRTTDVLDRLNKGHVGQHWVHVSTKDHLMVAFTPSRADGEADRQVTTTLGKLLLKFYPGMSDESVARVVNDHMMDVLPVEVKFAASVQDIRSVVTSTINDGSCMRYTLKYANQSMRRWTTLKEMDADIHPMDVYAGSPGFALAFIPAKPDSGSTALARAVTWVNPADASDKRYVRIYPTDGSKWAKKLEKALTESGYRCSAFGGARLRKIPTGRSYEYVMPYLDGADGAQSSIDGAYVVDDHPEYLRVLTAKEYGALSSWVPANALAQCKSYNTAVARVAPLPDVYITSTLTGRRYDRSASPTPSMLTAFIGDRLHTAELSELKYIALHKNGAHTLVDGVMTQVMVTTNVVVRWAGAKRIIATPENYRHLGYERMYPGDESAPWAYFDSDDHVRTALGLLDKADAVYVFEPDADTAPTAQALKDFKARMDIKGFVKLSRLVDGVTAYMHRTHTKLARTASGRWFHAEHHAAEYVKAVDGAWYPRTKVQTHLHLRQKVTLPPNMAVSEFTATLRGLSVSDALRSMGASYAADNLDAALDTMRALPHPGDVDSLIRDAIIGTIRDRAAAAVGTVYSTVSSLKRNLDGRWFLSAYYNVAPSWAFIEYVATSETDRLTTVAPELRDWCRELYAEVQARTTTTTPAAEEAVSA